MFEVVYHICSHNSHIMPLHRNHGLPSRLSVTDPTNAAQFPDPTHVKNVHHAYHLPSRCEWTNLYFVIKIKKKVKTFGAIHPWVNERANSWTSARIVERGARIVGRGARIVGRVRAKNKNSWKSLRAQKGAKKGTP